MEAEERTRPDIGDVDPPHSAIAEPTDVEPVAPETDGRAARANERCTHHPGRAAVARCDVCAKPVCLSCAVPVRGRVVGPECLATELGDPALTAPPEPDRRLANSWVTVAGALLALVATAGPWTRTGAGDRLFGAWVPDVRWSMVAAVAALLSVPAAWWLRSRGDRGAEVVVGAFGVVVLGASVLAILFPPTFQAASWGPWVAAGGGALAVGSVVGNLIPERHPMQGV